jgi:hypothetical protein
MPIEPGAFTTKEVVPDDAAVEAAIGPRHERWVALRKALADAFDPVAEAWTFSGKRYGWSLRVSQHDRPIVYLTPLPGRFRANLALPERAVEAALAADLPPAVRAVVAAAPIHAEGRAIRLLVTSDDDLRGVLALARIRMTG